MIAPNLTIDQTLAMPDYKTIPRRTLTALYEYIRLRKSPGEFLLAVLRNDLVGAVSYADKQSAKALVPLVIFVYSRVPIICYGNREKVQAWLKGGCCVKR